MELPKTIIICINTHGGIDCFKDSNNEMNYNYPTTNIPNKIKKIIMIDSVPFGTDISLSENEIFEFNNIIYKYLGNNKISKIETTNIINNVIKKLKEKIQEYINNKNINNYDKNFLRLVNSNNIFILREYKSSDKIVNKTFCYEQKDLTNNYKNLQIMNNKKLSSVDLFDLEIKKTKYKDGFETSLENILNFLSEKEVENIIFFDFSCYSFLPSPNLNERTIRIFRREINYQIDINKKRKFDQIS